MEPYMDLLQEIIDSPNPDKSAYMKQYPSFFEKFPRMSEMAFVMENRSMFRYMIEQKKRIHDDQSQHEASVNVGTMLRDTYITPVIDIEKKSDSCIVNNEKQL